MALLKQEAKNEQIGVAYIRESTEEQDKGFSPQNQERTIREYAKRNNIQITHVYKDLLSGTSADNRDDFQRMISDAMQRKFQVIVVFHTSRFARNVGEARHYKELLRKKLNIDVISATQNFGHWQDPSSFLNEGINELFDEHYSRQLSFWIRSAVLEKRRQGKQSGNPPLGYYKERLGFDPEKQRATYSQKWLVQEDEAHLVKRIFTLYATGRYSMAEISKILTVEGHRTKHGNPFTYSSLKGILSNKTYLGLVYSPRKNLPDIESTNHKAIISQELFDKCQDRIEERTKCFGRPTAQHRFYLLQGVIACHHCLERIRNNDSKDTKHLHPAMYCHTDVFTTKKTGRKERLLYACKLHKENKTCKQPNIPCKIIDDQVIDFLKGFSIPEDIIQMTLDKLREQLQAAKKEKKPNQDINKILSYRKRIKNLYEYGDMPEDEYLLKKQETDEQLRKLDRQGITGNLSKPKEEQIIQETEKLLYNLPDFINTLANGVEPESRQELRNWVLLTIKRVWVKDEKVVAIEPRDDFKPLFNAHKKVIGQTPLVTPAKSSSSKRHSVTDGLFLFLVLKNKRRGRKTGMALA